MSADKMINAGLYDAFERVDTVNDGLHVLLGFASVCWDDDGVFMPERASSGVKTFMAWLKARGYAIQ